MLDKIEALIIDNVLWFLVFTVPVILIFSFYDILKTSFLLISKNRKGIANGPSEHHADRYLEIAYSERSNIKLQYGVYRNSYNTPHMNAWVVDNYLIDTNLVEKDSLNLLKLKQRNFTEKVKHKIMKKILKTILIVVFRDNRSVHQ